jgi:hypothetical protein
MWGGQEAIVSAPLLPGKRDKYPYVNFRIIRDETCRYRDPVYAPISGVYVRYDEND